LLRRMNSSKDFCAWSRGPIGNAEAPLSADATAAGFEPE
jgi:hypothetical protein